MKIKELTDRDITELLSQLNDKLMQNDKSASILLSGGATMALMFNRNRLTQDIDAVLLNGDKSGFRKIVAEVGLENELKEDWLNDAVKGYIDFNWQKQFVPTGFSNLTVYHIPADKLLAMKLTAGRTYSKDKEDAINLMKYLDIKSIDEAIEILEDSVPNNLLTAKTRYFTMEVFDEYTNFKSKIMEVEKMSKKNEKENAKVKGSTKKVKENLKEKESKKEQTKENKKDITKEKVNAKEKEKETLEKEIQSLQEQIEDRQLDLYYADSFEQSGQIREDIQMMEAKLSSLEERLKKTVEKASEKENKNIKEKVYLNVHNDFAKIGLESRAGNGQTFNAVTLPRGSIINGKDMGGGKIYPLDMYIYQNKFNKNLTTVQFKEGQEVQVNFKNGEHIKVKAEDLCKGVTEANKEYLSKNKDIEKSIKKEKDNEMEI